MLGGFDDKSNADNGGAVGRTVRAARERRGWTREALAYHSGVSWAAITQIESGRRREVRLSSLTALAGALEVTVDYLVGNTSPPHLLRHRLFAFSSDDEFLSAAAPFVSTGVRLREVVLAVIPPPRIRKLRAALGPETAARVTFASSSDWYRTPISALDKYKAFVDRALADGAVWVRVMGEPMWQGRSSAQRLLWNRYESLVNLSFAGAPATLMCLYDRHATPHGILLEAERTHPHITRSVDVVAVSPAYERPEAYALD